MSATYRVMVAMVVGKGVKYHVVRRFSLPFVPAIGMKLDGIFWEEDGDVDVSTSTVEGVYFDVNKQEFLVIIEEECDDQGYEMTDDDLMGIFAVGCTVDGCSSIEELKAKLAREAEVES